MNLDTDEYISEIAIVTSVLKTWLRELPDPLLTRALHSGFLDAARACFHSDLHRLVTDVYFVSCRDGQRPNATYQDA